MNKMMTSCGLAASNVCVDSIFVSVFVFIFVELDKSETNPNNNLMMNEQACLWVCALCTLCMHCATERICCWVLGGWMNKMMTSCGPSTISLLHPPCT